MELVNLQKESPLEYLQHLSYKREASLPCFSLILPRVFSIKVCKLCTYYEIYPYCIVVYKLEKKVFVILFLVFLSKVLGKRTFPIPCSGCLFLCGALLSSWKVSPPKPWSNLS